MLMAPNRESNGDLKQSKFLRLRAYMKRMVIANNKSKARPTAMPMIAA
jgi:hypothetical protein